MANSGLKRASKGNEYVRVERAFRAIRRAGGMTLTGSCCRTCSWAEIRGEGAIEGVTTVAFHHVQCTDSAFPNGITKPMRDRLYIYHDGDSRFVCEALRKQGLRVEWEGDPDV